MKEKAACDAMWRSIRIKWGNGWSQLGDDLKRTVIAEHVFFSFTGMDPSTTFNSERLHARLEAMQEFCGLGE